MLPGGQEDFIYSSAWRRNKDCPCGITLGRRKLVQDRDLRKKNFTTATLPSTGHLKVCENFEWMRWNASGGVCSRIHVPRISCPPELSALRWPPTWLPGSALAADARSRRQSDEGRVRAWGHSAEIQGAERSVRRPAAAHQVGETRGSSSRGGAGRGQWGLGGAWGGLANGTDQRTATGPVQRGTLNSYHIISLIFIIKNISLISGIGVSLILIIKKKVP